MKRGRANRAVGPGASAPASPDAVATPSAPATTQSKRVLNVGGHSKSIAIPPHFAGWEHLLLDIDASVHPDVLCDARELATLAPQQFDVARSQCLLDADELNSRQVKQTQ